MRKEQDFAYYRRRAREEKEAAETALSEVARASHLQLSVQYEILAGMIQSELGRHLANDELEPRD